MKERAGSIQQAKQVAVDSHSPTTDSNSSANHNDGPPANPLPITVAIQAEAQPEQAREERDTAAGKRKEEREEADLVAQQVMAAATKEIVNITWWQFGVGIGGLMMLGYTLHLTREANRAALKSAKHAEDAINLAQNTAKIQLRAYLTVSATAFDMRQNGECEVRVEIRNTGQTPAYQISSVVTGGRFRPDFPAAHFENTTTVPYAVLGAGSCLYETLKVPIDDSQLTDIRAGRLVVTVSGKVSYCDINGDAQHTDYCHVYDGSRDGYMRPHSQGRNDAT